MGCIAYVFLYGCPVESPHASDAAVTDAGVLDARTDVRVDSGAPDAAGADASADAVADARADTIRLDSVVTDALPNDSATDAGAPLALSWDFESGAQGWQSGFADLPVAPDVDYELLGEVTVNPSPATGHGFRLRGYNHSDDLCMYIWRELTAADGVVAGRVYRVELTVDMVSRSPGTLADQCSGVGGNPNINIIGHVIARPITTVQTTEVIPYVRLTIDKGNQSVQGPDAFSLGSTENGILDCASHAYVAITRRSTDFNQSHARATVTVTPEGRAWVYVGTDSAYEGTSDYYIDRVRATLTPQ